jgi:hypothetical protein
MYTQRPAITTARTILAALLLFAISSGAQKSNRSFTILHNFAGGPSDRAFPYAGLTIVPGVSCTARPTWGEAAPVPMGRPLLVAVPCSR